MGCSGTGSGHGNGRSRSPVEEASVGVVRAGRQPAPGPQLEHRLDDHAPEDVALARQGQVHQVGAETQRGCPGQLAPAGAVERPQEQHAEGQPQADHEVGPEQQRDAGTVRRRATGGRRRRSCPGRAPGWSRAPTTAPARCRPPMPARYAVGRDDDDRGDRARHGGDVATSAVADGRHGRDQAHELQEPDHPLGPERHAEYLKNPAIVRCCLGP